MSARRLLGATCIVIAAMIGTFLGAWAHVEAWNAPDPFVFPMLLLVDAIALGLVGWVLVKGVDA